MVCRNFPFHTPLPKASIQQLMNEEKVSDNINKRCINIYIFELIYMINFVALACVDFGFCMLDFKKL